MPLSSPLDPEQTAFDLELRHIHYHSHRVIFHTDEAAQMVQILPIYYRARDALLPEHIREQLG